MKVFVLLSLFLLSGCGDELWETERPKKVAECSRFDNSRMEVGISDYQACVGRLANRTRPANRALCEEAASTMTADGRCELAE